MSNQTETKKISFRKVNCEVEIIKKEIIHYIRIKGKRFVKGSYPANFKDKKEYLIRLLKIATI